MTFLLPLFYLIVFILLIWRMKFFDLEGLSKIQITGLFVLKVTAGAGVWIVYTYYYSSSDFHLYFNSSKIAFDNLFESSSTLIPGWNSNFDDGVFNNSRIVIAINFMIHFLSFNNIFVHILFFCFLAFIGLLALYKALWSHFPGRRIALITGIFLIPSVLFWTAGIYKETITMFCLGLIIYSTDLGLLRTYSIQRVVFVILLFILLFFTKMYVAGALLPVLIANFIVGRTSSKNVLLKYAGVLAGILLIAHLFSKTGDRTNIYKLLSDKQGKAISEAQGGIFLVNDRNFIRLNMSDRNALLSQKDSTYLISEGTGYLSWELDNMRDTTYVSGSSDTTSFRIMYEQQPAQALAEINQFDPSMVSVYKNIPAAILNVLIQPTLFSIKNFLQLFSWLENIWLLLIIVLSILFFDKSLLAKKEILLFCLFLGFIQFAVIGLVTPNIGAIVRYKATALPFIVTACLLCIDYEKLYGKIKKGKRSDSDTK